MNGADFKNQQQRAVDQMREMNSRAMSAPPAVNHPPKPPQNDSMQGLGLPFGELLKDKDTALILGLLLILLSENADKRLLFALVYILL